MDRRLRRLLPVLHAAEYLHGEEELPVQRYHHSTVRRRVPAGGHKAGHQRHSHDAKKALFEEDDKMPYMLWLGEGAKLGTIRCIQANLVASKLVAHR